MKKFISIIVCLLSVILLMESVNAEASREVMEQYIPADVLDAMSQEQYDFYASLDYDKAITQSIDIPISDYPSEISPIGDKLDRGSSYSTTYKTLSLTAIPVDSITYSVTLSLQWKQMPTIRSFDVIALRFSNMTMSSGSQYGYQTYTGGNVYYSYNGTNMKLLSNGFGISMNLVNNTISSLQCFIALTAYKASGAAIYGAYEHATVNTTLAKSKKYTLSYAGMGNVINFDSSVWNIYDDMNGVNISL